MFIFSTTYIKNEKIRTTLISDADGIFGIRNLFIHWLVTDQNRVTLTSMERRLHNNTIILD